MTGSPNASPKYADATKKISFGGTLSLKNVQKAGYSSEGGSK